MDYYMKSPNSVTYAYSPPPSPNTRLLGDAEKRLLELNRQQDLQNIKLGNVTLNLDWAVENTSTFNKDSATYAKVNLYDTLWNLSSHDYTIKHWIKNYPNCIVEMIKTADKNLKMVVKKGILEEKSYEYLLALSSVGILSNILSIKKGLKFFLKRVAYVEHFFGLLVWTMFNLDYLHADDLKKEILRFIYFGTFNAKVANIYRYNENFYKVLKFCLQPSNTGDILETTLLIIQNLLHRTSDSMHSLYVVERLPARELKFIAVNGDYSLREMSESILKKAENIYHTHTFDSEKTIKDYTYEAPVPQKFILSDKKEEQDQCVSSPNAHDYKRRRCESLEVNVSSSDIIPCKKSKIRHKHRRKSKKGQAGDKFASSETSLKRQEKKHRHNKHTRKSHKIPLENRHVSCHLMEMQMKQQREEIISKEVLLKDVSNILDSIMKINSELIAEIGTLKSEIKESLKGANKFSDEIVTTNIDYLENETVPSFVSDKDLPSHSNFSKDTQQSSVEENFGLLDSNEQSHNSSVSSKKKSFLVENTQSSVSKLIDINKRLIKQVSSLRDRFRTSNSEVSTGSLLKKSFEETDLSKSIVSNSYFGTITFNNKFFANSTHSIQTENMNFVKTVSTSPSNSIRVLSPPADSLTVVPKTTKKSIGQKICDVINKTTNKIVDIANTHFSEDFIDKFYDEIKSDGTNNVLSPTKLSEILDIGIDISHGDIFNKKSPKNTLKSGIKKKKTTIWTKYLKYLKSKVLNILYINISYAMQKSSCLIHPYVLTRKDTLPMIKNLKSCKKQNSLTRRCYLQKSKSKKSVVSSTCCFTNTKSNGSFYLSGNFCDITKKISSLSFAKSSSQLGQLKSSSVPTFEFCSSIKDRVKKGGSFASKLPLLKKSNSGKKILETVDGGTVNEDKKHENIICSKKRTHKIIISTSVAQTDIQIGPK